MTRGVRILLVAGVLAALGMALWQLDPVAVRRAFAGMSWRWGAAAALTNLFGLFVDACRWRLIINARRRVPLWSAFRAMLAGVVGNIFMPLKLGEGARALLLARSEQFSSATSLTTVLLDRVVDVVMLPLYVGLASLLLPLPPSIMRYRPAMLVMVALVALLVALAGHWIRRQPVSEDSITSGNTVERIVAGLAALGHTRRLAWVVVIAMASWTTRTGVIWCMLQAFHLPLSATAAVATLALINLGIAIVATPGNIGSFELAAAGALGLWGISPDAGLSLGIATHALEVIPTILLGLMLGIVPWKPQTGSVR